MDGEYQVSLSATLFGPALSGPVEFNVFAVVNHVPGADLDPLNENVVENSQTVVPGGVTTLTETSFLTLRKGDRVELFVSNGVGSPSLPIQMFGWGLRAIKTNCLRQQ
jgi:hypothetical protein